MLLLIAVFPVLPCAAAASITTVTFGAGGSGNFGFTGTNSAVISDTVGGVLLTAMANVGDINGSSEGIGVYHYNSEGGHSDDGEIDDHYFVDRLLLNFSVPVTLTEVVVGDIELNFVQVQFLPR